MVGIGDSLGPGGFFAPVPAQRPGALTAQPGAALPAANDVPSQERLRQERLDAERSRTNEADSQEAESRRPSQEERDTRVFGRPSAAFLTQLIGQRLGDQGSRARPEEAAVAFASANALTRDGQDGVLAPNGERLDISI